MLNKVLMHPNKAIGLLSLIEWSRDTDLVVYMVPTIALKDLWLQLSDKLT